MGGCGSKPSSKTITPPTKSPLEIQTPRRREVAAGSVAVQTTPQEHYSVTLPCALIAVVSARQWPIVSGRDDERPGLALNVLLCTMACMCVSPRLHPCTPVERVLFPARAAKFGWTGPPGVSWSKQWATTQCSRTFVWETAL